MRIDIQPDLDRHYSGPGREQAAVEAAFAAHPGLTAGGTRLIRKTADAMRSHRPTIAPYTDAIETFGMLQGLGMRLVLIAEGAAIAQRSIVGQLSLQRVFGHILYTDPANGKHDWLDTLMLAEVLSGAAPARSVAICPDTDRHLTLTDMGYQAYRLYRDPSRPASPPSPTDICNLYDLPDILGLIIPH